MTAIGLAARDLFLPVVGAHQTLTVEALSQAKNLPVELLKRYGVTQDGRAVRIPYRQQDGTPARTRIRIALSGKSGSIWSKGERAPIVPYGIDHQLAAARKAGYLLIVEGKSDSWACWNHEFPAVGIPGASMAAAAIKLLG